MVREKRRENSVRGGVIVSDLGSIVCLGIDSLSLSVCYRFFSCRYSCNCFHHLYTITSSFHHSVIIITISSNFSYINPSIGGKESKLLWEKVWKLAVVREGVKVHDWCLKQHKKITFLDEKISTSDFYLFCTLIIANI